MKNYIDSFVIPVKNDRLDEYKKLATLAATVWKEHGALEYIECVADDVKPGKLTSFPQSVNLESDETVIFAYIVYKSRAHRDEVNKKSMEDPRLKDFNEDNMPFDCKRMIWGGFIPIVQA